MSRSKGQTAYNWETYPAKEGFKTEFSMYQSLYHVRDMSQRELGIYLARHEHGLAKFCQQTIGARLKFVGVEIKSRGGCNNNHRGVARAVRDRIKSLGDKCKDMTNLEIIEGLEGVTLTDFHNCRTRYKIPVEYKRRARCK